MRFDGVEQRGEPGLAVRKRPGEVRFHSARLPRDLAGTHPCSLVRWPDISTSGGRGVQMDIREQTLSGAHLVAASGRLDSNSAGVLEAVLPGRAKDEAKLILDLSEVPYVSSAGLRVLLIGAKAARAAGHKLVLTGLSPSVREVFDISGFTSIFTIEADVDSALAALA